MANKSKKRRTVSDIKLNSNLRCDKVYLVPSEEPRSRHKASADLETMAIQLSG